MTDIYVWLYGKQNPIKYENIFNYYETREALVIVQEELYLSTTTKIFKKCLQAYQIVEAE
jgi:hypothetical protein